MAATRKTVNFDHALAAGNLLVPIVPPRGYYWLWDQLYASFTGPTGDSDPAPPAAPNPNGVLVLDVFYMTALEAGNGAIPSVNGQRVLLKRQVQGSNNHWPIFGGGTTVEKVGDPVQYSAGRSFLHLDQETLELWWHLLSSTGAVNENVCIRGLVWESADLSELQCIARGLT